VFDVISTAVIEFFLDRLPATRRGRVILALVALASVALVVAAMVVSASS
jgi:hypothetical protein